MNKRSKRAEERAFDAYPVDWDYGRNEEQFDWNEDRRKIYLEGYEQAEKDILSLIESRLSELLGDAQPTPILRYELQDLIKKIKEEK